MKKKKINFYKITLEEIEKIEDLLDLEEGESWNEKMIEEAKSFLKWAEDRLESVFKGCSIADKNLDRCRQKCLKNTIKHFEDQLKNENKQI